MIVISVEGLATSALGCYGSSWNETPAADLISSRGVVWDRVIAGHDDGLKVLAEWLKPPTQHNPEHWITRWNELGPVELITDDPRLSNQSLDEDFDQAWLVELDEVSSDAQPCDEIEETHLARLFAALLARIEEPDSAAVWWLHTQSLVRCWDAPRWLVPLDADELYSEEPSDEVELLPESGESIGEDELEMPPWVFSNVLPPQLEITSHSHPDLAVSWMRTYGCQVRLLDRMMSLLIEYVSDFDPVIVLVGTSGFSLGQNGWLGYRTGPLRSCHHRVPMVVSEFGPVRHPALTEAASFPEILAKIKDAPDHLIHPATWAATAAEFEPRVVTHSDKGSNAITTPRWYCVQSPGEEHLYLKPDDVDDHNDISRLRHDVVEHLASPLEP